MTIEQMLLYGGAMWVGPAFLAGSVLLFLWFRHGPFTPWGKRRAEHRRSQQAARLRERFGSSSSGPSPQATSERPGDAS